LDWLSGLGLEAQRLSLRRNGPRQTRQVDRFREFGCVDSPSNLAPDFVAVTVVSSSSLVALEELNRRSLAVLATLTDYRQPSWMALPLGGRPTLDVDE